MIFRRRLWLVGDDEALDALADLSRHLDYFQVARVDELPRGPLTGDDHVVIATADPRRAAALAGAAAVDGAPGHVGIVPDLPGKSAGARAIAAAAALIPLI
jgi:hypothetical protein